MPNIAGIAVLRHQLERHLFAAAADEQGDVRLLDTLRLVDGSIDMIIFALEDRFVLRPHCQDDLYSFAQVAQAFGRVGIVVAIGAIFMFVPTSADTEIESPMR